MSEVWLRIIAVVSVCCTALSQAEDRGVVWRDVGDSITIQCRTSEVQEYLDVTKGLNEDTKVFFMEKDTGKNTISAQFESRLQTNGAFPNVDILIKNLTANDTGPYWCIYKAFDRKLRKLTSIKGSGSLLLVVTRDKRGATEPVKACDASHQDLVMVSVVISAAVLLCILMAFLIMIILKNRKLQGTNGEPVSPDMTRSLQASVAPRRLPTNDVYEDMRGTFRR